MPSEKDSIEDKLARKAARVEKAAEDLRQLQSEALDLEEKYEASGHKYGVDFDVHTSLIGNFVVRKPDFAVAKKFSASEDKGPEEVIQFVAPCILFPEQQIARLAFQEHAGVAWRLAALLMKLYEADAGIKVGK